MPTFAQLLPEFGKGVSIDDIVSKITKDPILKALFETSPHGMVLVDGKGAIKYLNGQQAQYFGFSQSDEASRELNGKILFKDAHFCDADEHKSQLLREVLAGKRESVTSSRVDATRDDGVKYFNMHFRRLDGGVCVDMTDITKEIVWATTDPLTGVYNRAYFYHRLFPKIKQEAQKRTQELREPYPVGVIYVDLKEFKKVNDTYGHDAGDEVLKNVANLLAGNVNKEDFVIRWGGDEFIVICPGERDKARLEDKTKGISQAAALYNIKKPTPAFHIKMDIGFDVVSDYENILRGAEKRMYEHKRSR